MIVSLTLKCFRKHTDTKIDFTRGLNVLRGSNEAGKTTVLEGMLYALYGAKALRDTLAETVTWGRKEGELRSILEIDVGGQIWTFERAKSGAEATCGALRITGHSEVTAHAAELLGADAKTASLLMLSSQSGLRGALDDGPAAVSSLMGRLADFDLIDRIVEAAQAKLLLGSDAPFRTKLATAEQDLDALTRAPVDADAVTALAAQLQQARANLTETRQAFEQVEPDFKAAEKKVVDAIGANEKRADIVLRQKQVLIDIRVQTEKRDAAQVVAGNRPDAARIQALRTKIADAGRHDAIVQAHQRVLAQPAYPEIYWDQPRAALDDTIRALERDEAAHNTALQLANQEITTLTRSLVRSGKCPTCGHDSDNDEHVRTHNAEVQARIETAKQNVQAAAAAKAAKAAEIRDHVTIVTLAAPFEKLAQSLRNQDFPVTIDDSVVPPRITWQGPAPVKPDVAGLQNELNGLLAIERTCTQAEGTVKAHEAQIATLQQQAAQLDEQLAGMPEIDVAPLQATYSALMTTYLQLKEAIEKHTAAVTRLDAEHREKKAALDAYLSQVNQLRGRIEEYKADLVKLEFNNALVKKLRNLKPAITDHLWNTVLAAVSNFFSSLRGEESVVTKEASGFRVNGQSIESLSGSTLDVLALAVRVALTKTFIPNASFIVLDEPFAACDTNRTGGGLGFLSSVGFQQTLLASHDELSESVAENVISLGY